MPVYTDQTPVAPSGFDDQRIYRPAVEHPLPRPSRATRMSFRAPFALLPWVGVVAAVVWLPLAVLGVMWTASAYWRGYRGAGVAALLLLVVVLAHFFSAHAVHPFF